jgi:hypothetical protein
MKKVVNDMNIDESPVYTVLQKSPGFTQTIGDDTLIKRVETVGKPYLNVK